MKKIYKILILPRAKKEILDGKHFFEARRKGFGKVFSISVNDEIQRISTNPFLFKQNEDGFIELPKNKFPYLLIYSVIDDKIIISSFFHTSRNPQNKPTQ